jgi:hypothetical protein
MLHLQEGKAVHRFRQKKYRRLALGAALVALFVTGLVGLGARAALAATSDVSPGTVQAETTTLYWSGQGTPVNQLCGPDADFGAGAAPNGATPNSYLLWIFTTDGGGISGSPTLSVNGTQYTGAFNPGAQNPDGSTGAWQIVTPYIDPATIAQADPKTQSSTGDAFVNFAVADTGNGKWVLTISHGCAGPNAAAAPTVTKTAAGTYDNKYTWTVTKSADTSTVYSAGGGPSSPVNYTVHVTHGAVAAGNVKVTGTITVTNPNPTDSVPITGVTDTLSDGTVCAVTGAPSSLPPGATQLAYECDLTALPATGPTNTVVVSWGGRTLPHDGTLAAGSASFTTPQIAFTPTTVDSCISVSDPLDPTSPHQFCAGQSGDPNFSFGYPATFTGPAGTCSTDQNTATGTTNTTGTKVDSNTVTVTDCQGGDLTVTKTATPSFTRTYTWGIAKAVDQGGAVDTSGPATFHYTVSLTHDNGTDSNWLVTGVITVTNPNDWEAVTANVTDAIDNGGTCTVTGGTNVSVPASGSVNLPYTCTYAKAPSPASGTNTATVTWDSTAASTPDGAATGTAAADFSSASPNIVDGMVSVTDSLGGPLGTVSYTDPSPKTFTYPITFTDPAGTCTTHPNTAIFTTNTGKTGTASQSVTVCVGADLQVAKTAAPSFTRTFGWSVVKQVDNPKVTIDPWTSATFHYTVTLTHDTGTDTGFVVAGTITVQNPNDWEAVAANVTDAIGGGGTCVVTGGTNVSVPASGSVNLPYTCTFNSNPVSGTNTATATWNAATSATPDATTTGTAGYTFGAPTTVKGKCATATDTFNGGSPLTLGVACIDPSTTPATPSWTTDPGNTLANFHEAFSDPSFTLTYARTIHAPAAGTCVTYANTAKFTPSDNGTGGSGGATVQMCAYQAPFTIGYWGNHLAPNGTAGCTGLPNGTGCSSNGPWASKYLPQPLGTYSVTSFPTVAKVIAANNCSNASSSAQNAVGCLAAQLLAAELNVAYGANACIVTAANGVNAANGFLSGIPYTGPTSTYSLSTAQRAQALALKNELVNYNQGGGC